MDRMNTPPHFSRVHFRRMREQSDSETMRYRTDVKRVQKKCDRAHRISKAKEGKEQRVPVRPVSAPTQQSGEMQSAASAFSDTQVRPSRVHEDHGR